MSSTGVASKVYGRVTTQRNLTIFASILVAVPTAYAFQTQVARDEFAANFLLLMTLPVGIPSAYDEYWPQYDRTWEAIVWVFVAAAVVTVEFTGLSLLGSSVLDVAPLHAAIGALLVTDLGNLAWLAVRQNR
jgi:hypothetical protein